MVEEAAPEAVVSEGEETQEISADGGKIAAWALQTGQRLAI